VGAVAYGRQIGTDGRSNNVVRSCLRSCAVFFALLFSAGAGVSQPTPLDSEQLKARVTVSAEIETIYGEGKGDLASYAQSFRTLRLLETVAGFTTDELAWPVPFTLEMQNCGFINARWNDETRKLTLCYELAADFAELGRDFGKIFAAKLGSKEAGRSLKRSTRPSFRGTRTSNGTRSRRSIAGSHDSGVAPGRAFKRHP